MKTFKRRLRQSNEGPASGVLFTKAENVAVRILDVKSVKIIDEKLRGYASKARSAVTC
jgi:hypothetical protein